MCFNLKFKKDYLYGVTIISFDITWDTDDFVTETFT